MSRAIIEQLEKYDREYIERMQKGLGHHSWWYTNRASADCVNVKIHSWPDLDECLALLTERERKQIERLGIKADEIIDHEWWAIVSMSAEDLAMNVRETVTSKKHALASIEYGGRNGGWACLVFELGGYVQDFIENDAAELKANFTGKELRAMLDDLKSAQAFIDACTVEVEKRRDDLKKCVADPATYTGVLQDAIEAEIENRRAHIQRDADALADISELP